MEYEDIASTIKNVASNYHYRKPPDLLIYLQDLIERIWRFISDLLNSLRVPTMADTRIVGNVMQTVLFCTALLAVLAVIYVVYRRLSQLSAQTALSRRGQAGSEAMLDADGWLGQAQQMAGNELWKESCRALYFSLLRRMAEREVLEFVPTRTNYEYWYALSRQKPLAVLFREMADIVEISWFGYHQATKSDYEQCLKLLQQAEDTMPKAKVPAT